MNVDNLPLEVRQRIDGHLDAIEEVLKRDGMGREERRNIVDNVETQLLEMLGREAGAGEPTLGQVEVVLGRMDRPEAYGRSGGSEEKPAEGTKVEATLHSAPSKPGQPRTSRAAIWGAVFIGLSLLGWGVAGVLMVPMFIFSHRVAAQHEVAMSHGVRVITQPSMPAYANGSWVIYLLMVVLLCVGLVPSVVGTFLGWTGVVQIRMSKGMLRGKGLAWFAALFYPILVAVLAMTVV